MHLRFSYFGSRGEYEYRRRFPISKVNKTHDLVFLLWSLNFDSSILFEYNTLSSGRATIKIGKEQSFKASQRSPSNSVDNLMIRSIGPGCPRVRLSVVISTARWPSAQISQVSGISPLIKRPAQRMRGGLWVAERSDKSQFMTTCCWTGALCHSQRRVAAKEILQQSTNSPRNLTGCQRGQVYIKKTTSRSRIHLTKCATSPWGTQKSNQCNLRRSKVDDET